MSSLRKTLLILLFVRASNAFVLQARLKELSNIPMNASSNKETEKSGGFMKNFFNNLDGIAEDFFYKRMGKGEIFYGKRRYKPSGDVEGDYEGMGLSDKLKIDMAREYREAWLEEKQMRDEMRKLREEKERRNA